MSAILQETTQVECLTCSKVGMHIPTCENSSTPTIFMQHVCPPSNASPIKCATLVHMSKVDEKVLQDKNTRH